MKIRVGITIVVVAFAALWIATAGSSRSVELGARI